MKKIVALVALLALSGCWDSNPPLQPVSQAAPVIEQVQPVGVQQTPVIVPVVVPVYTHSYFWHQSQPQVVVVHQPSVVVVQHTAPVVTSRSAPVYVSRPSINLSKRK